MSQIFKKKLNPDYFFNFIQQYGHKKNNDEFVFNHISYKKANYNNDIEKLVNHLVEYYHKSKQFYLTRNMNYKNFVTIIRQVCNYLCIPYTSKIIYSNSKYNINYVIYLEGFVTNKLNDDGDGDGEPKNEIIDITNL